MGRLPAAWEHFETATAAAREAGDHCLLAFAAGEQAYVLLDLGQPAEALDKVRAVYDQTGAAIPDQIRGWLRAAEGEMAAAARQQSDCHRALDLAATEISHGPAAKNCPTWRSTTPTWPAGAATASSTSVTQPLSPT